MYTPSERVKLNLLCLLLLLMLGVLAFTAVNTFQAVQSFRQQYNEVKAGDVSTIHPWMTIHVVSQVYKVPEDYLYHSLQLSYPNAYRHTTLYELASHKRQPVDHVIYTIQHAILTYRKIHPKSLTPASGEKQGKNPPSPTPGRTHL